jgi:hypothetical protein
MYDGRCEPRDIPDEEGIRTVCEELNMSPISDRVVIYNRRFSEKEKRALEQGLKHFATVKIDEFLAFKTEHTVGRHLLMLRQRFQVRTRNILLVIHWTYFYCFSGYFGEMHVRTRKHLVIQRRVCFEDGASNAFLRGNGSAFATAEQRHRSATDQRVVRFNDCGARIKAGGAVSDETL